MIPLIVAGGALVAGGILFSKSNETWTEVKYVRDIPENEVPADIRAKLNKADNLNGKWIAVEKTRTVPESEVPADIREKFKGANDSLKVRRIATDEVPTDVREQARKDKNNRRMK